MARRFRVAPPFADDCPLCELPLDGSLRKTKRGWAHRACIEAERGE